MYKYKLKNIIIMWLILERDNAKFSATKCIWRNTEEEARSYKPYYPDIEVVQIIFVKEGKQY